jgi:hypothetical protein
VGVPNWTRGSSGEGVGVGDTVAVGVTVAVASGMDVKVAVISSVATACSVCATLVLTSLAETTGALNNGKLHEERTSKLTIITGMIFFIFASIIMVVL